MSISNDPSGLKQITIKSAKERMFCFIRKNVLHSLLKAKLASFIEQIRLEKNYLVNLYDAYSKSTNKPSKKDFKKYKDSCQAKINKLADDISYLEKFTAKT